MSGLTFRPWARNPTAEPSISEALQRARFERGPFRGITEASLQEELAAQGALDLSESEDEDEDNDAEGVKTSGKPDTREELFTIKNEMLQHVVQAEQDIGRTLDFLSLVLSKDAPGTVAGTLSAWVKEKVPQGTFGVELWQRMSMDAPKRAQEQLLATNVRLQGLQQSADGLLAAASRLESNVRKERKYWNSILSVSDKGWNVCRVPKQQHRLAVTFGFSESSPMFSRKGIAALDADEQGNVRLERGIGSRPEALRVVLKKNGKVAGSSKLPDLPSQDETTLETRIRHARDSLFDGELFHEMIQESRNLASLGIGMQGNTLRYCDPDDGKCLTEVVFEIVRLDQQISVTNDENDDDDLAQSIAVGARLLLIQAHRERLQQRSKIPAVLGEKKESHYRLQLLRPLMSFVRHRSVLDQLNAYIKTIKSLLSVAEITSSGSPAELALPADIVKNAEDLCKLFLRPWSSDASISIHDASGSDAKLQFTIATSFTTGFGPVYTFIGPDGRRVDYANIDELRCAADSAVAAVLTTMLGSLLPGTWKALTREARIEKEGDNGEIQWIQIGVDSFAPTMSLITDDREVEWKVNAGGTSGSPSFWEAWKTASKAETVGRLPTE